MRCLLRVVVLILGLGAGYASAQPAVRNGFADYSGDYVLVSPTRPMPVTGNNAVPTYSAAVVSLSNTSAGDLYCVTGSSSKIVRIKGIRVSAVATAAAVVDITITLRSSLSTGGGLASVPVVRMDQNNPAPTAVVNSFTTAPSAGSSIGVIRSRKIAASTQGNAALISEGLFQFSVYRDQPIVLRGAAQAACVTTTAIGSGGSWDIDHEHTEEEE